MPIRRTEDLPVVGNYPRLQAWLDKHEARPMWSLINGDGLDTAQASVEGWMVRGGAIAILVIHANKQGWNIFTSCDSNKIDETFADAEQRLKLV